VTPTPSPRISVMTENTREWLRGYWRRRAHLASEASDFQCDPDCTRPGCKSSDLQVPVSLVDLLGAARHRGESVSALYRRHYVLGLFYNDTDYCLRTVSLKLQKPCPFLADDLCALYPVRPLPCILFPEVLVSRGLLEEQATKEQFRDYLCLRRPLTLSPERTRILSNLQKMWERESLIASFYFFGHGHCHLDFTNLIPELLSGVRGGAGVPAGSKPPGAAGSQDFPRGHSEGNPESMTHRVLEDFFQEQIAPLPPFAGVGEKIAALDTPEGQAQFLKLLQDEGLYKKLLQDTGDRDLVFRFINGKLKPHRRSVLPSEYKFYG
jgi:Fe-S-cluster containining protein